MYSKKHAIRKIAESVIEQVYIDVRLEGVAYDAGFSDGLLEEVYECVRPRGDAKFSAALKRLIGETLTRQEAEYTRRADVFHRQLKVRGWTFCGHAGRYATRDYDDVYALISWSYEDKRVMWHWHISPRHEDVRDGWDQDDPTYCGVAITAAEARSRAAAAVPAAQARVRAALVDALGDATP